MKLAISNIAWDYSEDSKVRDILSTYPVSGVELAPTKIWPDLSDIPNDQIDGYRSFWAFQNLEIIAFQALLFGKPNLKVFDSAENRTETYQYLCQVMKLASQLGAKNLVFGSPKNRQAGNLRASEVIDIAIGFFTEVAEAAVRHNVCFCIEPNPAAYGCDFIQTAIEGLELVQRVDHPGFRLHLDAGAMTMNGEHYETTIAKCFDWLAHFHISEPQLKVVGKGETNHLELSQALHRLGYNKTISIEMLNQGEADNIEAVRETLKFVTEIYGTLKATY